MILVGNQRGGARDLARHLMKQENERVDLHELRGFVADDLEGAFQESYAISRGTKCKQFLFSLSLNPPKEAEVSKDQFLNAINATEARLGLKGQPRAIVFHEKRGDDGELRRHAHAVWSRIQGSEMKAIPLSYSRLKLQDISRDLYLEHGWKMPRGLAVSGAGDPRNFSLAEWQQAKRLKQDPRDIKAAFQDAWAISDTKSAFSHALQERGYWLCRGDRRGYVAVDMQGEIHNIAKRVGIKTKEVRDRLGDIEALASLAETKKDIAQSMQSKMTEFRMEVAAKDQQEKVETWHKRAQIKDKQRHHRQLFQEAAQSRKASEESERQKHLRTGLAGIWDRVTGKRKRTLKQNAEEARLSLKRTAAERRDLIAQQLAERRKAIQHRKQQQIDNKRMSHELDQDRSHFQTMAESAEAECNADKDIFKKRRRESSKRQRRSRSRDGPEPEL